LRCSGGNRDSGGSGNSGEVEKSAAETVLVEVAVKETVVLEAAEADTALAAAGASNNQHNSGGSVKGSSGQQSTKWQRQC
jgi:hypothetical protein